MARHLRRGVCARRGDVHAYCGTFRVCQVHREGCCGGLPVLRLVRGIDDIRRGGDFNGEPLHSGEVLRHIYLFIQTKNEFICIFREGDTTLVVLFARSEARWGGVFLQEQTAHHRSDEHIRTVKVCCRHALRAVLFENFFLSGERDRQDAKKSHVGLECTLQAGD